MGAMSGLSAVPRRWRTPKTLVGFFIAELPLSIAILALFGIAQPDLYRTRFWQEGSDHGWNSNPNEILYALANYKPISTPLPWSQLFVSSTNIDFFGRVMTDVIQHHKLQRGHRRSLCLSPAMQRDHVHMRRFPSTHLPFHSLWPRRRLGREHPQPSRVRYE